MGFDYYAQQDLRPQEETIAITIYSLNGPNGKHPVLHCVYAGGDNDGWNADTMLDADEMEGMFGLQVDGVEVSAAERERRSKEGAARLRRRLARHVIRTMDNVVRDDGSAADTSDDIAEWIQKIPAFVVVWLLQKVTHPLNFQKRPEAPARPAAELAAK